MSKFFQNLILHDYQAKTFYHALRTKGFVIIAGLSGTGKTKIFEEFCLWDLDEEIKIKNEIDKAKKFFNLDNLTGGNNQAGMQIEQWHDGKGGGLLNLIANPNKSSLFNPNSSSREKIENLHNLYDLYRRLISKIQLSTKKVKDLSKHCFLTIWENKYYKLGEELSQENQDDLEKINLEKIKGKLIEIKNKIEEIDKKRDSNLSEYIDSHPEDKATNESIFSRKFLKLILFLYAPHRACEIFKENDLSDLISKNFLKRESKIKKLFFPIRPDFKDSKSLLGYYNPLNGKYHKTELLDFIIEAQKEYLLNGSSSVPYLVLFDEMNLARVEYYFADFLSILESKRVSTIEEVNNNEDMKRNILNSRNQRATENDIIGFYSKPIILHNEEGLRDVPQKLYLPPNLYFIGSVNIDETTHTFSPKVLDRAFTIEFDADIGNYIEELKNTLCKNSHSDKICKNSHSDKKCFYFFDFIRYGKFAKIEKNLICELIDENKHGEYKKYIEYLEKINSILKPYGLDFGYRVFDEILIFIYNATKFTNNDCKMPMDEAFDLAILMKVLPKFHGTRQRLEEPVRELLIKFCELRPVNSQQQNNQSQNQNQTNQQQSQQEERNFTPECMPTLEINNNSKRLKIKDKEYEAKFPHTAKKLIEILYKLITQGSASFM
ncbi:MAG: hypothetical protein N2202_07985 [Proteobacteria bacterium]|nr:hypothetical protein [Pseudomonadota bacterium]